MDRILLTLVFFGGRLRLVNQIYKVLTVISVGREDGFCMSRYSLGFRFLMGRLFISTQSFFQPFLGILGSLNGFFSTLGWNDSCLFLAHFLSGSFSFKFLYHYQDSGLVYWFILGGIISYSFFRAGSLFSLYRFARMRKSERNNLFDMRLVVWRPYDGGLRGGGVR